MDASGWPPERWAVLGEAISKARRANGWDQQELARRSGNSPNTISNYERGRASRSRRVPGGYIRVAHALGWPPDAPQLILAGEDPETVIQPSLFEMADEASGPAGVPGKTPLMSSREIELTQSGHLAQDAFMRQAKRYRKLKELSVESLAQRIAELGGDLPAADLVRLENGTRLLQMAEARLIAQALDTSVDWLLGSAFHGDAPEEMRWPPNDEELEAEAKAVQRRMAEIGAEVTAAHVQYTQARQREEQARQAAEMAMLLVQQMTGMQREMERHYQYLLGRIDSIRAARGDETVIQMEPVYEDDGEGD
ncbi:helix-turn-helix domain-containing protein [Streptomyces sp. I4(2020)]|uniref:helix-turn-helix domain-containing protein n=1 Tax=Streptomyces sp. I4(2020) TaxID=2760981 RepID=UPI0018EE95A1|nr:helix-turn-helix transcriptional regulator [Streptomyces sp. I4(2020)]MBJ6626024.1 helix-turn-helix transcriptional regulator [Streptomyces sp. I4(2020)]